jgi:hypothetical protein
MLLLMSWRRRCCRQRIAYGLHLIRIVPPLATYRVSRETPRIEDYTPRSQVASIDMIVIVMNVYVERLTVRV